MVALLSAVLGACGDDGPPASDPGAALVDQAERDRLRALGYVDTAEPSDDVKTRGVVLHDRSRAAPYPRFFANALGCSAQLIAPDGRVLHTWRHEPCGKWGNAVLLPDGDVLVVHWGPAPDGEATDIAASRELIRLGWDGRLVWARSMSVHHDLDVRPDGTIAALTYHHRLMPEFHPEVPVRDSDIEILRADGTPLERASLQALLATNPAMFTFENVTPRDKEGILEVDLLHANAIEWMHRPELAARDPLYATTNVLVCVRNQDLAAIIDWRTKRLVWAWGPGVLASPHDATMLDNGNILIFDNGMGRGWSRVVEMNPLTRRIVWEYGGPGDGRFYSNTRGAAHRLPGGNTLVTVSAAGRVFEVDPTGDIVWDFRNPNLGPEGSPSVIVRTRGVVPVPAGSAPGMRFRRSD
jgi:hypothetical protein